MNLHIKFYVDEARSLQNAILNGFSWFKSFSVILDWYYLKEKCKMELSLSLRNRELRNIIEDILQLLWLGKIDDAINKLRSIPTEDLKKGHTVDRLIGYFERNRGFIPCYALRKKIGLRNSSNKGEKANDLIVADRQKHNGMSWSKHGSIALATITALHKNREQKN